MEEDLLVFNFSDGEQLIRTFSLTQLKRISQKDAIGYLTVTNQRIIYQ